MIWKPLSYEYTPRPTHTRTSSLAIKRALPVLAFRLVAVFSADCSGSGLPFLVLLMWRDDTCRCWIELHKGFQIKNTEWRLGWAGVLFLPFILLRNISGLTVKLFPWYSAVRGLTTGAMFVKKGWICVCVRERCKVELAIHYFESWSSCESFKWNEWIESVGWPVIHGRVSKGNWIISQWWNLLEVISLQCFIGRKAGFHCNV